MNFCEGLTVLFIYLKLTHQFDWSWLAVVAPEIISFLIYIVIHSAEESLDE
jgi:hypothetical protein